MHDTGLEGVGAVVEDQRTLCSCWGGGLGLATAGHGDELDRNRAPAMGCVVFVEAESYCRGAGGFGKIYGIISWPRGGDATARANQ